MKENEAELARLRSQVEQLTKERDEIGVALRDEVTARLDAEAADWSAQQQVARLKAALEPFARLPATGKRGGAFVIAHAVYTDMTGRRSAPRSAYWHWKDFERARVALTTEKADG